MSNPGTNRDQQIANLTGTAKCASKLASVTITPSTVFIKKKLGRTGKTLQLHYPGELRLAGPFSFWEHAIFPAVG